MRRIFSCLVLTAFALGLACPTGHAQAGVPNAPRIGGFGVHIVKPGETVFAIASRYGLTVRDLALLNGTQPQWVLLPGRQLWVPLRSAVNARANVPALPADGGADLPAVADPATLPAGAPESAADLPAGAPESTANAAQYTIAPQDTLFSIARRFGVSLEDLKRWNGLPADGSIRAGDVLALMGPHAPAGGGSANADGGPADAPAGAADAAAAEDRGTGGPESSAAASANGAALFTNYRVAAGDTLTGIAERFSTSAAGIQHDNQLDSDAISIGQILRVPRSGSGPAAAGAAASAGGAKKIEVDVSAQRMMVWQGSRLVWNFVVSTGEAGRPTRRGTFHVQSKIPNAWSTPWQLWMPNWLGIYWAGASENGIHALPIINGKRLWAGYLGTPISYGCVVLGIAEAEKLYNWAEIGTTVVIHD